jgi:uncharacterized coiled-coil DUF342 family protein
MTVEEKFELLASRIDELTENLRRLRGENQSLKQQREGLQGEIEELRSELGTMREQYHRMKLDQADRSALVTSKLTTVLQRLDELESLEQG